MGKALEPEDLNQVIREERRRGRRPLDESRRKARERLVEELFEEEDEASFLDSIRALGLQEGSASWQEALASWRDEQHERGRAQRGRR
jgi:hypothetical protein